MSTSVAAAVLAAALLHALWNALIKGGADRLVAMGWVSITSSTVGLAMLPFLPLPAAAAWPYLAASVVIHVAYRLFLVRAYAEGDMAQVYPLARGSGPLIVTLVGVGILGEALPALELTGVLILILGILVLAFRGGAKALDRLQSPAALYALATGVLIAAYTLADGIGARLALNATSYTAWMFALDGWPVAATAIARRGWGWLRPSRTAAINVAGGLLSLAAYGIVIWAMTRAPIPAVAALRETSILFAMVIGLLFLGERLTVVRFLSGSAILTGVVLMRLG